MSQKEPSVGRETGFCCLGTSQQKRRTGYVAQSQTPWSGAKGQQGRKPLLQGKKDIHGCCRLKQPAF